MHELYIILEDFEGVTKFARYAQFAIGAENEHYALVLLGEYSGTAGKRSLLCSILMTTSGFFSSGDSLSYHAGSKFSTFESDNDVWLEGNCASSHAGGWWYNSCDTS